METSITNKVGKLTGKVFASTKKLPKNTASTAISIKDEFLAGFKDTAELATKNVDKDIVEAEIVSE